MPGHASRYGCLNDLAEIARPNAEVALELRCTRCGALSTTHAPIVAVHSNPAAVDHNWDGIVLPFILFKLRGRRWFEGLPVVAP